MEHATPDHLTRRVPLGRAVVVAVALVVLQLVVQLVLMGPTPARGQDDLDPGLDHAVVRTDGVEGTVLSQANPVIDAHVWDIEFIGNTAFVAGKFLQVVRATTDWSRVDQPFLAAFDASTGEWKPGFRPQLDGPVWALDQADGVLVAGGEFAEVNGQTRTGLVGLDPRTGATDPTFGGVVQRPLSEKLAVVRDVHVDEARGHLYAIGNFSHASDGVTTTEAAKVVRFSAATGQPDAGWTPVLAGRSGWAVDVSPDGERVFLGGEFQYVNGVAGTELFAAVDAATGALVPDFDHGFNPAPRAIWPLGGIVYDLAVAGNGPDGAGGEKVFLSGAENFWEARSTADGASLALVTSYDGSWFNNTQSVELELGRIYIGCHCIRHHGYANHDIDPATNQIIGTLTDHTIGGEGVWATDAAPDGCLWMGGDLRGTTKLHDAPDDGTARWVGRIARYCPPGGPPEPPQTEFELLAAGSTWRVSTGARWPQGWTGVDFDAQVAGWGEAAGQFGYGDGDETTVIDDTNRPAAVLARTSFTVDDPTRYRQLLVDVQADDGATVWLNGQPVAARRVADGQIAVDTLATEGVWGSNENEWHRFHIAPDALVAGANVVAVSVHQATTVSRDLSFDLTLRGSTELVAENDRPPTITVAEPPPEVTVLRPGDGASRYLVGDAEPPADWTTPGFDDRAWTSASGTLGFGEDGLDTEVPGGRIAYYIRAEFDVPADLAAGAATIDVIRDDGAVVYINGIEVGRDTMADGPVDSTTLATGYVWGDDETSPIALTVPAGTLVAGRNVVAVEVHQAHPDSRDLRAGFEIRSRP